MTTESTSYTRESFVEFLLRKSVPQLEQSLCSALTEHAVWVFSEACKYISAIVMAAR